MSEKVEDRGQIKMLFKKPCAEDLTENQLNDKSFNYLDAVRYLDMKFDYVGDIEGAKRIREAIRKEMKKMGWCMTISTG